MPNWCSNSVNIYHDDLGAILAIKEAFARGDLCETFLPIKHVPADQQYDVAINTWGTKWDVKGDSVGDQGHYIYLVFESAWTPPLGLYNELVRRGYVVYGTYFEPGVGFVGQYENGTDVCYDFSGGNFKDVVPADLLEAYDIGDWFDFDDEEAGA